MKAPLSASIISDLLTENAQQRGAETAFTILGNGHDETDVITHAALDLEARSIASRLQRSLRPGDRALILTTENTHFIRAFMACQYAGVIAVPVAPPLPQRNPRKVATLQSIAMDCAARVVLSDSSSRFREPIRAFAPWLAALEWIDVDTVPQSDAADFRAPHIDSEDIAFLQYTSGSTSLPKGVMVSHRALMRNEEMFAEIMGLTPQDVIVSWLPLFHDMGLIGKVLQASYLGTHLVLMPSAAFVQRPSSWLRALTRYRGTMAGAPDFAYAMCVNRIPEHDRAEFDLTSWKVAFSGAEPIRPATFDAFAKAYAPCGLARETLHTAYGLAEVTLIASGGVRGEAPITRDVNHEALRKGHMVPGDDYTMISVGKARLSRRIVIVDPETRLPQPQGTVGEVWLGGTDIPLGYWRNPEATRETFGAHLAGTGEGPFLRTGDLGVLYEDELYITGRLKDIIIVSGRNHYPQDIERSAEAAHPWVRPGFCAAFAMERDGREEAVLVAEVLRPARTRRGGKPSQRPLPTLAEIRRHIVMAVSDEHGMQLDHVQLIPTGTAPKTSSGKIQRTTCRLAYENGELPPAPEPGARVEGEAA